MNRDYVTESLDLQSKENNRMWGESTWESQSEGFLSFFFIFSFKHYSVFRLQEMVLENVLFIEQGGLR